MKSRSSSSSARNKKIVNNPNHIVKNFQSRKQIRAQSSRSIKQRLSKNTDMITDEINWSTDNHFTTVVKDHLHTMQNAIRS